MVGTSPGVQAWSCAVCGTDWSISRVSPRPSCDHLVAAVQRLSALRSVLREVIVLASKSPRLTDEQLRERLLALADRAVSVSAPVDG